MSIKCGSQFILCPLPVRFDTYINCTHGCKYCFAYRKHGYDDVKNDTSKEEIKNFILGHRNKVTQWCDWDIPLHWGGMSDPFQPCEKERGRSYEILKVLADYGYPVVVSSKGVIHSTQKYINVIKHCNIVVQMSMACKDYDVLEPGAPTYIERLKAIEKLSSAAKRTIVRVQPYFVEKKEQILQSIIDFHNAGVYGVIFEGFKSLKAQPGMVKVGADLLYPYKVLKSHFAHFKEVCHQYNLVFLVGENRLRSMGDSLVCCGTEGVTGFKHNTFNPMMIVQGVTPEITAAMKKEGSGNFCRFTCDSQSASPNLDYSKISLYEYIIFDMEKRKEFYKNIFGYYKK